MKLKPFPSEEEQEEARRYVLEKPIVRTNVTYLKVFIAYLLFIISVLVCSALIIVPLELLNIFEKIREYIPISVLHLLILLTVLLIGLIIFLKKGLILLIKCYQNYASVKTRRRCLCKPTCSEYAIAVLKKYNLFKALYKIRIRLFITCKGNVYQIDEP